MGSSLQSLRNPELAEPVGVLGYAGADLALTDLHERPRLIVLGTASEDNVNGLGEAAKGILDVLVYAIGPAAQVLSDESEPLYAESDSTDIAIGLRPDLCGLGKGLGLRLTGIAVNFVLQEFPDDGVRLAVSRTNGRAIKVYLQSTTQCLLRVLKSL